ncbi:MAG: type II toxin-antitoxin system YoeB family toxin [Ruminococcus sp.]|nr:type II toxin-antitoxin system YoeB family toxin [Ruminococcus sp.]
MLALARGSPRLFRRGRMSQDIDRNGNEGIGKPERLSGDLSAYWSRRIDDANRIVYRIDGEVLKIVQCGSHDRDK